MTLHLGPQCIGESHPAGIGLPRRSGEFHNRARFRTTSSRRRVIGLGSLKALLTGRAPNFTTVSDALRWMVRLRSDSETGATDAIGDGHQVLLHGLHHLRRDTATLGGHSQIEGVAAARA